MAMPLHDEQLFAKYAFARLRDIENSQQRAQIATMEKEAKWGRFAKWALGTAGLAGVGLGTYGAYKHIKDHRKKHDFEFPDTSSWDKPEDFWNKPTTGASKEIPAGASKALTLGGELPDFSPASQESNHRYFRVPSGMNKVPSDWQLEMQGEAYGVPMRRYSAPSAPTSAAVPMQKRAGVGTVAKAIGKGALSDVTTSLFGNWGAGGILKGLGRVLGAESKTAIRQGTNNATLKHIGESIGDTVLDGTKTMSDFMKKQNDGMVNAAKDAVKQSVDNKTVAKAFDATGNKWNSTRRYMSPAEARELGRHPISNIGQYLAYWGQKLTDLSDAGQHAYRKSLYEAAGNHTLGQAAARKAIGATSLGLPIGYAVASEFQDPGTWWAAPGQYLNKAWDYMSLPGLVSQAGQQIGRTLQDTTQQAMLDGMEAGVGITAGELANQGRMAYLGGLISPDKLSKEVLSQAKVKMQETRKKLGY
jgi:hypothetical protein